MAYWLQTTTSKVQIPGSGRPGISSTICRSVTYSAKIFSIYLSYEPNKEQSPQNSIANLKVLQENNTFSAQRALWTHIPQQSYQFRSTKAPNQPTNNPHKTEPIPRIQAPKTIKQVQRNHTVVSILFSLQIYSGPYDKYRLGNIPVRWLLNEPCLSLSVHGMPKHHHTITSHIYAWTNEAGCCL